MTKGEYTVQDGNPPVTSAAEGKQASRDTSFRTCVLLILIFLMLCIVLLLATWPWRNSPDRRFGKTDAQKGEEIDTTLSHRPLTTRLPRPTHQETTTRTTEMPRPHETSPPHFPRQTTERRYHDVATTTTPHHLPTTATRKPDYEHVTDRHVRIYQHPHDKDRLIAIDDVSTQQPPTTSTPSSDNESLTTESHAKPTRIPYFVTKLLYGLTEPSDKTSTPTSRTFMPLVDAATTQHPTPSRPPPDVGSLTTESSERGTDKLTASPDLVTKLPFGHIDSGETSSTLTSTAVVSEINAVTTQHPTPSPLSSHTKHLTTESTESAPDNQTRFPYLVTKLLYSHTETSDESSTSRTTEILTHPVVKILPSESITDGYLTVPYTTSVSESDGYSVGTTEGSTIYEVESIDNATRQNETRSQKLIYDVENTTEYTSTTEDGGTSTESTESSTEYLTQDSEDGSTTFTSYSLSTEQTGSTDSIETTTSSSETTMQVDLSSRSENGTTPLDSTDLTDISSRTWDSLSTNVVSQSFESTTSESSTTNDDTTPSTAEIPRTTTAIPTDRVCNSSECKVLASRMLSLMNHSVNPCDDFYEFSCGGLKSNPGLLPIDPAQDGWARISDGVKSININSSEAHTKFQDFYYSCLNYDLMDDFETRKQRARAVLDDVGVLYDKLSPVTPENLTALIAHLMKHHSTPVFDITLDVDGRDKSRFALKLTPPIHKSIFRHDAEEHGRCRPAEPHLKEDNIDLDEMYGSYVRCKQNYSTYLEVVEEALIALDVWKKNDTHIQETRIAIDTEVLWFYEKLPPSGEVRRNLLAKNYTLLSISDLQRDFSTIDWYLLLRMLLEYPVPLDTQVQVYFVEYFNALADDFLNDARLLHNALLAMFAHDLYVDLVETRSYCDREKYCLRVASGLMEDVSSALYLASFPRHELEAMQHQVHAVFQQLQGTMKKQISSAVWLDDKSRSNALDKMNLLNVTVDGGMSVFLNEDYLNNQLRDYHMDRGNYLDNSVNLLKRYRKLMYSIYNSDPRKPAQIWSQFLLPYSTEGIVLYGLNTIVIPFGLLTKPLLDRWYPQYVIMAGLGNVIVHEISHHFDKTGIQYDHNGNKLGADKMLSTSSYNNYKKLQSCAADQFSGRQLRVTRDRRNVTFTPKSDLSYNERFADDSALRVALDSYRESVEKPEALLPYLGMTESQLYYLSLAQVFCSKSDILDYDVGLFENEHLPPFLRVNTFIRNSKDFSTTFECSQDSNMRPFKQCESFPLLTVSEEVTTEAEYVEGVGPHPN